MPPPGPLPLQQLQRLDRSLSGFCDQLSDVLCGEEYQRCVPNLQGEDSVWLVDYLDNALEGLESSSAAFRKCLRELRNICGTKGILPTSYTISSRLLNIEPDPFASGGFGDVYHGTLDGSRVCVKRMRMGNWDSSSVTKIFCQEAVMWKHLTHPNVLPLLGVTITPLQLISDLMPGGDLPRYVKNNPDANLLGLLSNVADGLRYLHSCNVIHGGIKGLNILVDDSGHACIADLGSATVVAELDSEESTSDQLGHTPRWAAPESLNEGIYSKEADVFSFAMVMIEVFTGAIPFSTDSPAMAMLATTQGKRPPRPAHPSFTDGLWALMQRCWDHDPRLRPEASEVLQVLITPEPPAWNRLITNPLSAHQRAALITTIFSDHDMIDAVGQLSGDDAQAFIDVINEALDDLPQRIRRTCLRALREICGRRALLPKSLVIPLCYDPTETPRCRGGFADTWKGQYGDQEVAAKALRVYSTSDSDLERIRKGFCEQVVTWKALHHPNVSQLLGVTMTENRFVMVSEWANNGNVTEFVKVHTDVNRPELLGDVTMGLIYMHDQGIIHGVLKGASILIDRNGRARISDFGLLAIVSDQETFVASCIAGGMIPWMSPELLDPEGSGLEMSLLTKESDCYALGMVIYEILSGLVPFTPSTAPILDILRGERPERPQGEHGGWFTDGIWGMLELCWKPQPHDRPSLDAVLQCLQDPTRPSGPPSRPESDARKEADDQPSDSGSSITRRPMAADSSTLPRSTQTPQSTPNLSTARGDDGLPISPLGSPPSAVSAIIPLDGGRLPSTPRADKPKRGWIGVRLARGVRKFFETIVGRFHEL